MTNAGDSLYYVAAKWLVYDLGGSAFYTELAGFLALTPQATQFLMEPFVDRWDLRQLLVGTQLIQGALVLVIPVAAMTGWLSVTVVLVVMTLAAMVSQFVCPAQNAALPRIVHEEDLVGANSAFSTRIKASAPIIRPVWCAVNTTRSSDRSPRTRGKSAFGGVCVGE